MDYKVVFGISETFDDALDNLEGEVNEYLKKGWKLQGGVSLSQVSDVAKYNEYKYYTLCQAIVKEN